MVKKILRELYWTLKDAMGYARYFHKFGKVGSRTVMKKPIRIINAHNIEIGERCFFLNGLRIETIEKWNGQHFSPHIRIGNDVTFGQMAHVVCASGIDIGDNVSIGPFSMINDCTHGYMDAEIPLEKQDLMTKPIRIGEGTIIGMSVCVLPGVQIGRHCYIGANTLISKDVPDNTIVSAPRPRSVQIPY